MMMWLIFENVNLCKVSSGVLKGLTSRNADEDKAHSNLTIRVDLKETLCDVFGQDTDNCSKMTY